MFPKSYFAKSYFPGVYFPPIGVEIYIEAVSFYLDLLTALEVYIER